MEKTEDSPGKAVASTSTSGEIISVGPVSTAVKHFKNSPFGEELLAMILKNKIDEPLVFRQIHRDWGPCKWTLGDWGDIFRDEKLTVRYGQQKWDHVSPQWESLCGNLEITWTRLIEWVRNEYTLPFDKSSPEDIWMYYDYKYLPEVIHLKSDSEKDFLKLIYLSENLKKMFCWQSVGFADRNGDHSTLWIGTNGSYTNTHYDTYSCNMVCQVYGNDHFTRVREAVLRAVVSSVVNSSVPSATDRILNPNEMDLTEVSDKDTEDTLKQAAKAYFEYVKQEKSTSQTACANDEPRPKKPKVDPKSELDRLISKAPVRIEKMKNCTLWQDDEESSTPSSREEIENRIDDAAVNDGNYSPPQALDNGNHSQSKLSPDRSPTFIEEVLNELVTPVYYNRLRLNF